MRYNTEPGYIRYLHARSAQSGHACSGTFEITARCNFNCRMCYIHSSDINISGKKGELSADEWVDIARSASAEGLLFLLITGGEPLIREDFETIYRKTREMGILVSVNTNGYLLNDELIAMFKKYPPRRLNISLYGDNEKTYKELCGIGGYEKVSENLGKLKSAGINVKLNMPATRLNAGCIGGIFEKAEKLNVPLQAAGYVFPPERNGNGDPCRLSPEEAAMFDINAARRYKTEEQFSEYARNSLLSYTPLLNCDGEENSPCRAGKSSFWITWNGKMLPCGMMSEPAADVRKEGFSKAWELTEKAMDKITLPPECAGCRYRCVCSVCAAKTFCETGSFSGVPRYLCEISRIKYEYFKNHSGGAKNEAE